MPRVCVNSADNFCYICGELTVSSQKRVLTTRTKNAYHQYFNCKVGDQDKPWAPRICCNSCVTALNEWLKKKTKSNVICSANDLERTYGSHKRLLLPSHSFHEKRIRQKEESLVEYPNILSAIRLVPHSDELPVPETCEIGLLSSDDAGRQEAVKSLVFLHRAHPGKKNMLLLYLNHV